MDAYEKLLKCRDAVRARTDFVPDYALVLGSGLNWFAENIAAEATIPYGEIDGFPVSTVPGHEGRFIFGKLCGKNVVAMQGRVHYYEGYAMTDVVLPIRLMGLLGAKTVILTNAAGGINPTFKIGDFMLLTGQIASFVPSPLIGANLDAIGPRFSPMTDTFDLSLRTLIKSAGEKVGVSLREGVYVQASGPQFESPQEINMFRILGADAVGMSTACEVIAARHMGLKVAAVSCITNMAAGIGDVIPSHEEVQENAAKASERFTKLLLSVFAEL